jgi:hypothetical protein
MRFFSLRTVILFGLFALALMANGRKHIATNATSITLEPSVGRVGAQGSTTVKPSQSTTYTVTATGPGGSAR